MKLPPTFVKESDGPLVNVIVETPRGSRNKFTYDAQNDFFRLGKVLPAGNTFPLDFGFLPGTKGDDGDPLDVLVLMEQSTYPGCVLGCRIIGNLEGEQAGPGNTHYIRNDRFLAVPDVSADYRHVKDISDFGQGRLDDIFHFFKYYHNMAGGDYRKVGACGSREAMKLIKEGRA